MTSSAHFGQVRRLPAHDVSPAWRVHTALDSQRGVRVSFEFFPPKSDALDQDLWGCARKLSLLNPEFVSVTYGASGSTRAGTQRVVQHLANETPLNVAAHLTCVGASRAEIAAVLSDYWAAGVRHIVALRGDPPEGINAAFGARADGYANATELTRAIRAFAPFEISVGCYPEKHPESPSLAHDIAVLKAKQDAGADRAISQFFFDVDAFLRYVDGARTAGVTIPIVPGIMPATNFSGLRRMAAKCGASIPSWLATLFEGLEEDAETRGLVATSVAADMCLRLKTEGFEDFHFYTLNRPELSYAVCRMLGVKPFAKVAA